VFCDRPSVADNGEVTGFVQAFRLLCKIEPISGQELLRGNQIIAEGTTRIRCFWSPQGARITALWRLRHASIIYNISGPPAHIEFARREIEIIARHGANAG
jgi:SPP1 family predicted phage head-tail adaptor